LVFGGGEASYLNALRPSITSIRVNFHAIPREIVAFWGSGHVRALTIAGSYAVCGLAAIGFIARLARRVTVLEIFPVLYLIAVIIWPSTQQGSRLLIPVVPFLLFFAFAGMQFLGRRAGHLPRALVAALMVVIVLATYSSAYASADFGPIPSGVTRPDAIRFFRFIDTHTPRDAIFIFRKPRALALFTDRSASVFEPAGDASQNWAYFQQIHAGYLALAPEDRSRGVMGRVVATYRADLVEIYQADSFRIYRIVGAPGG
jgi:hypothetical protein